MKPFGRLSRWSKRDVGVDLGSARTRLIVFGRGVVLEEPSVVAVGTDARKVLAAGRAAQQLAAADPAAIRLIRPIQGGFGTDGAITAQMLRCFFRQAGLRWWFLLPRLLVSVPSRHTADQFRALSLAGFEAKARQVAVLDALMAGALGAGLDPLQGDTALVVGLGGGIAEVAALSGATIRARQAPRCSGNAMDEAIARHLRRTHRLIVTDDIAEETKLRLGAADGSRESQTTTVAGRDADTGDARSVEITGREIAAVVAAPLAELADAVLACLETCPREWLPELAAQGVILFGGGALLPGIVPWLAARTGLPMRVADPPLLAVARGVESVLGEFVGSGLPAPTCSFLTGAVPGGSA